MSNDQNASESPPSPSRCSASPPPIGIVPKRIWVRMRFWDLAAACNRYLEADRLVPAEWKEEMREHLQGGDEVTRDIDPEIVEHWQNWING